MTLGLVNDDRIFDFVWINPFKYQVDFKLDTKTPACSVKRPVGRLNLASK